MFRYLFILYLLCVVMTTKAKCAVTRPQEKLLRRSSELPVARPEILPGLVEELQFRSTLPSSTKSAWRQAAEVVLSRTQRNVPYPIEIEMHRVEATADPGITCGACRVWRRYITFYKPTCLPTKIPVRSCRGLCESWEIPHHQPPYFIKHHPVCRPIAVTYYRVTLRGCQNPRDSTVRIAMPERCACGPCESSGMACGHLY